MAWTRVGSGGVVLCLSESGFSVYMTGPGSCVLCLADTCTSEVHPVFNHVYMNIPNIQLTSII